MKKTKKERRRRGRNLPRSRTQSRAQKSSEAGRHGGEGMRREEQRDEGQCERTDEFVSVRYIRDIFVNAHTNGNNPKTRSSAFSFMDLKGP